MLNKKKGQDKSKTGKSKMGKFKPGAKGKFGKPRRMSRTGSAPRKRYCRFCVEKVKNIDYKDRVLERMISDRGKVLSRRFTGNCARHQRAVARAIRQARFIAILPFTKV